MRSDANANDNLDLDVNLDVNLNLNVDLNVDFDVDKVDALLLGLKLCPIIVLSFLTKLLSAMWGLGRQ